ncbi:MAG: type II toxin-antitoxin system VapC family toxin [Caldilineaceae bacterium]
MSEITLLDSDILSYLLPGQQNVVARAQKYLAEHEHFHFSLITRYEILCGLKARNAVVQIERFDHFCAENSVVPLTDEIIQVASSIYARLYQQGTIINDADILIAATTIAHDMTLATNNTAHFSRVGELHLDNWAEDA